MPVPQRIFDPPFNIVRSSHIALGVADLGRSRAFYTETLGLIVEDADRQTLYLRGIEETQHRSLVLRHGEVPTAQHLGFKVGSEEDLDKAARYFKAGIEHAFVERPYHQGRTLTAVDPYGMPVKLYFAMEKRAAAAALGTYKGVQPQSLDHFLCPGTQRTGRHRFLCRAGLPADRACRGG